MNEASASPLAKARALYDLVAAEAGASEAAGRLTERATQALLDAGLFSMLAARSDGGAEASLSEYFLAVETIAKADGSAGWCLATSAAAAYVVSKAATPEARRDVFGAGPVALMTNLLEGAKSAPAPGGYSVSGRFGWGSGSAFAHWAVVNEGFPDRYGQPWYRSFLAPRADLDIDAARWRAMGLEATASAGYAIADKFVPQHRSFAYPFAPAEPAGFSSQTSARLHQIGLTAFASGVAARALTELTAAAPKTRRLVGEGALAEDVVVQRDIGEQDGLWRAARAHYFALLGAQDRHIAAQGAGDPALALDLQQAAFTLTRAARDLTLFAFDAADAGVVMRSHPIQRCLRDILTGLKHATFTPSLLARIGKRRLEQAGRG